MANYHNPYSPNSTAAMVLSQSQMRDNAKFIYGYMNDRFGWTLNAVAGLLGNIEAESTMNPARPQNNAVRNGWYPSCPGYTGNAPSPTTTWYGFGIFQVTPYMALEGRRENPYNFGNWAYSRGYTFDHVTGGTGGQMEVQLDWLMSGAPETSYYNDAEPTNNQAKWYDDDRSPIRGISTPQIYGSLTESPEICAEVFYWNLERSDNLDVGNRPSLARKWFDYLYGTIPEPPEPPDTPDEPEPPEPPTPTKRKSDFIILAYGSGLFK